MSWGNVCLVTRIGRTPEPAMHNSWTGLVRHGLRPSDAVMPAVIHQPAHWAANTAIRLFRENELFAHCDTLCFVDDDHAFSVDTLERLRSAGEEYGVLGALYVARTQQRPLVMRYTDESGPTLEPPGPFYNFVVPELGGIVDVDCCGFGFTLIRRTVLEALPPKPVWYIGTECTEDVAFCVQVQQAGFKLGVHTGVEIDHIVPGVLRVSERSADSG